MGLAKPLGGLFVGPLKRYRPIEGMDVARAMANVALARDPRGALSIYESDRIAELARPE
jgi:hypothetical protein